MPRQSKPKKQARAAPPAPPPTLPAPPPDAGPPRAAAFWRHVSTLNPWDKNPRINAAAVPRVAASILEFGFPSALTVWDVNDLLVAGHTRLKALLLLLGQDPAFTLPGAPGPGYVPVRSHAFRDENHAHAYAVADNRLSEIAEWDDRLLHDLAHEILDTDGLSLLGVIGFEDDELARVLAEPELKGAQGGGGGGGEQAPPHRPTGTNAPGQDPGTGMRLVQFFLVEGDHAEYLALQTRLAASFGVKEPGDVVLRAMRAATEHVQ